MKKTWANLLTTIFGAMSSLITALILSWIARHYNTALYAWMISYIVPVGAIGSGFVAASGYYLGSLICDYRPSKLILLNMIAISLGTYFLIQYLDYIYLVFEGEKASNFITFLQYLDLAASHTTIQLGSNNRNVMELGNWGYLYALLQIIGFSIGGFLLYGYLSELPFCKKCSRYFSKKESVEKYSDNSDTFGNTLRKIASLLEENRFEEAIATYATEGGVSKFDPKNHHLRLRIILKLCKGCGSNCLYVEVANKNSRNDWCKMNDLSFHALSDRALSLHWCPGPDLNRHG